MGKDVGDVSDSSPAISSAGDVDIGFVKGMGLPFADDCISFVAYPQSAIIPVIVAELPHEEAPIRFFPLAFSVLFSIAELAGIFTAVRLRLDTLPVR